MPALGMAQETGRLVRWLKQEGDQVAKGEPLMEVETDKAIVEVESPASGTLAGITAAEGAEVAVGGAIAVILAQGEVFTSSSHAEVGPAREVFTSPSHGEVGPARESGTPGWGGARPGPPAGSRPMASPKARRLALERGIDLAKVVGSGPGGAIVEEDILQAGDGSATPAASESALWRAMADNVTRSWKEAPHFFLIKEIDAASLVEARNRLGDRVTYTDLILHALAAALGKHPRMNGTTQDVNIGMAVAVPDGLIVPVIHGVDRLSVEEIAGRRHELVERVKGGHLRSSDLSGGTFTLSNLGMYGIDLFTAILTEGQAGILAVGRIADRVVARDGVPAVRPTMLMSLSCDHRLVDGARAAEFMRDLVYELSS
jgi:pyruvate dehydrogenase E2 component (dihydrolipoamide acetyltransferase)